MEVINFKEYDEVLYYEELANGLKVYLMPKLDYHKVYASFVTKYGSLDIFSSEEKRTKTGIAHYLEHMLFNNEERPVEEIFNQQGATLNAYTSINHTCYYFSTMNDYLNLLEELLNFVLFPKFTPSSLEKERLIILEELKMYLDDKVTNLVNTSLANLYYKHPIRYDIGGLIEEVSEVSLEELIAVHQKFYQPANMFLFLTGNIDVEKVMAVVKAFFADKEFVKREIPRFYPLVKKEVPKVLEIIEEGRNVNKSMLAFKIFSDIESLKLRVMLTIYLSLALSETSDLYEKLMNEHLINHSFSYNLTVLDDTTSLIVYSDTGDAISFEEQVLKTLKTYKVKKEDFVKFKNKYLGATFNALNNLENIMYDSVNSLVNEHYLFDVVQVIEDLDYQEMLDLNNLFDYYTITRLK